jgi:hypothetical protein
MRVAFVAVGMALLLGGCETFEPYSVQYDQIINESGVSVYGNLMEDFSGARWWQFTANNSNDFSACVRTSLTSGSTSGHTMGGSHLLGPGETVDIGYVELPGSFNTDTRVWNPRADGSCGSPPD